uniref:Uncharacterized protein n=1 Tax=virus sp. ctML55 TaxID=2827627 RepID=A0A8S5RJA5_9VIRU|nr:MAG TPA: hypothetical protein [virus sp. ctML55]DAW91993.1 MAG TPA: hypothetical protein [Bacteriophage sp.]
MTSSFIYFPSLGKPIWIKVQSMSFVNRSVSSYFIR